LKRLLQKFLTKQFILFVLVGIINTLFAYGVFAFFIFINLHYTLASLLQLILGVLFNFKTTGKVVFNNNDHKLIGRFFAVYILIYGLYLAGLKIFNIFEISNYIAGAILLPPLSLLTFLLQKEFVFKNKTA